MTLKEMRTKIAEQITLVKQSPDNIPQAESIANLAGKMLKTIQLEIQAEIMISKGDKYNVLKDIV
jgi:hypothetical protein